MSAITPTKRTAIINRVKLLTRETDDTLVGQLVDDAVEQALNYTHRTKVAPGMEKPVGDLAIVAYNRLGTQGEAGRTEGGEKYEFIENPASIYSVLKGFRLARVCGNAYEEQ